MNKKHLIAVKQYDELRVHIRFLEAGYDTLCGLEAFIDGYATGLKPVNLPENAIVDCPDCLAIVNFVKKLK